MSRSRLGRPGVPASTSRNGCSPARNWVTFSSAGPTSGLSVCASSRISSRGRFRTRASSSSSSGGRGPPSRPQATVATSTGILTSLGRKPASQERGAMCSANGTRVGTRDGVRKSTSSPGNESAAFFSNHLKHCLPVAAGSVQEEPGARRVAAGELGKVFPEQLLLALPPREVGRSAAEAGTDGPQTRNGRHPPNHGGDRRAARVSRWVRRARRRARGAALGAAQ